MIVIRLPIPAKCDLIKAIAAGRLCAATEQRAAYRRKYSPLNATAWRSRHAGAGSKRAGSASPVERLVERRRTDLDDVGAVEPDDEGAQRQSGIERRQRGAIERELRDIGSRRRPAARRAALEIGDQSRRPRRPRCGRCARRTAPARGPAGARLAATATSAREPGAEQRGEARIGDQGQHALEDRLPLLRRQRRAALGQEAPRRLAAPVRRDVRQMLQQGMAEASRLEQALAPRADRRARAPARATGSAAAAPVRASRARRSHGGAASRRLACDGAARAPASRHGRAEPPYRLVRAPRRRDGRRPRLRARRAPYRASSPWPCRAARGNRR